MFKERKKNVSTLGIRKPENRLLMSLRSELGSQVSSMRVSGEVKGDMYEESQRMIAAALAEAEYQKAKAIMTTQQNRSFC